MRRAVCSGSFDPVTNGHIDIFERASTMFDEIIICVFHNVNKQAFFPVEERVPARGDRAHRECQGRLVLGAHHGLHEGA